ncbi:MAG: hypothetical protein KMY54_02460 [Erysipelothrix sp.]|nr:hypothetical protein [Erysipelothrix sp.]
MTIKMTYFCTQCGTRLTGKKPCRSCGFDIHSNQPYGNTSPIGAGGFGWSEAVDDPRFAGYQGSKRTYITIFALILIILIPTFLLLSGDLNLDSEGITVIGVVSVMLFLIAIYSISNTKRKGKEWIGKIVDKRLADGQHRHPRIIIKIDDGTTVEISFDDDLVQYEYYTIGDVVKKHNKPNLRTLEKQDKRRDVVLFCPSCAYQGDARDHYCQACGSPLLKGK